MDASNRGKSTLVKQMRLKHGIDWSPDEREDYRYVIFSNTLQSSAEQAFDAVYKLISISTVQAVLCVKHFR